MKRTRKLINVLLALVLLVVAVAPSLVFTSSADTLDTSMTLHQVGNQLFNERGQAIRLLGVNVPQLGWSLNGENRVEKLIDLAINDWQSNYIRLPVKPSFWLGLGSTSQAEAQAYRDLVDDAVAQIAAAGKYVLLDNHCFYLPGEDSELFWADAAEHYKNHPNVIFGLFNEPAQCSWTQYFEGAEGYTYQGENEWGTTDTITLNSKGVPNLLKIVRATGAKNLVTISGLTWGFDLEYVTHDRFLEFAESRAQVLIDQGKLTESGKAKWIDEYVEKYEIRETTGNGIMFETHPYPEREADWDTYLYDALMEYPVMVGECGPTENRSTPIRVLSDNDKSYLDKLANYMDQYDIHLTAWSIGAWPYLNQAVDITKPSAYGEYIRDYIIARQGTKSVQLFTEAEFEGTGVSLFAGKYNVSEFGDFDISKLGSVWAKDDYYQYAVTFYEKADQAGKSYTILPDTSDITVEDIGFKPASLLIERKIRENILVGHATATANGSVDGNTPDLVVDGKTNTYWQNRSDTYSELIIKLDKVYALNGITLAHAGEAGMLSSDNNRSYAIAVSTNGKIFTRVADVEGNGLGYTTYSFDQTPASYISVKVRKGSLIEPELATIAEVMAYGTVYDGKVDALPGQIAIENTNQPSGSDPKPDDAVDTVPDTDTDVDTSPVPDTDADVSDGEETPDPEVDLSTPEDVPDRTYYMDSEGNIYYIDDNGDKVLVDDEGNEIGRIPQQKPVTTPGSKLSIWPFIIGAGCILLGAAIGVGVTVLVIKKKKVTGNTQG